jgi:hypothetical protein
MKEREQAALRKLVSDGTVRPAMMRARVVKGGPTEGGKAELLAPRYVVDVQPLLPDGGDDPSWPVLSDVEVPVLWAGAQRGVFGLPAPGSIVRLGFYYDDPSQPYVDGVLAYGWDVPAVAVDELVLAVNVNVRVRLTPDGIEVFGPVVKLAGATSLMRCLYTGSDHPALPLHITSPGA